MRFRCGTGLYLEKFDRVTFDEGDIRALNIGSPGESGRTAVALTLSLAIEGIHFEYRDVED